MKTLQDILINHPDLKRFYSIFIDHKKDSIRIRADKIDQESLKLGQSRFGGLPDLPSDFDWPLWQGKPLSFLTIIFQKTL